MSNVFFEQPPNRPIPDYPSIDPDPILNNLAEIAALACNVPIAWISLRDIDRHRFVAVVGIELHGLPHQDVFCIAALQQTELLIVPDATRDDRFAQHPLVVDEPRIRFYAAMPLWVDSGNVMGMVSVMGSVPHTLTSQQQEILRTIAQQVMLQLQQRHYFTGLAAAAAACHLEEETLRRIKDETELRVAERTVELVGVNQRLRLELDERKRIEAALRISQARFSGILEIANDAIIATDRQQLIQLFNQGAEKIFGYSGAEIIGQPLDALLPDRFVGVHRQHVAKFAQSSGQARRMGERQGQIIGRRKDGTEFPAEASISKLELGEEKVYTVILRDVTQRQEAEAALEQLSRQNELILNSVGEGLLGLDLQGKVTFVNPAAAKMLGYRVQDLTGRDICTILPNAKFLNQQENTTYANLDYHLTQDLFHRQDGSRFPVEYVSTPIQQAHQTVGAVVVFRDISDRQIVERMKDEFISVVSHELRTPLTSIHGALGMLASGLLNADPQASQRLLHIAVDSTDRLIRLINDILDIERIESGRIKMQKERCNVADLIHKAVDVMQPMADRFNITLAVQAGSEFFMADPDRIIQALTNLLSNAIKFSPTGETVWIRVERLEDAGQQSRTAGKETKQGAETKNLSLLISVQDKGRGIPEDKLETIFERFQQVDASDSRNHDGTGLGLAICRSIMQQHQGQVWAESELGKGSTFYLTVPIAAEEAR